MYSRIVKWICVAVLVLAATVVLHGVPQILLQLVVCGGALFVTLEAFRSQKYMWAGHLCAGCSLFQSDCSI